MTKSTKKSPVAPAIDVKAKKDLEQQVMQQICTGKVKMRPRWYFIIGSISLGVGAGAVIVVTSFFFNLVVFKMRTRALFGFSWLGRVPLKLWIEVFPWEALLVAIAGFGLGIWIVKRCEFSYRYSLIGWLLGLVALILVSGVLIDLSGFNERVGPRHLRPFYTQPPQERKNLKRWLDARRQLNEIKPFRILY
ncbi:MAG: hypothetical protein GF390_02850 [Candidatus Pacebacteria bacterium]|nr:hypothetical protein [Candidatus Paceibacterota bacterium]